MDGFFELICELLLASRSVELGKIQSHKVSPFDYVLSVHYFVMVATLSSALTLMFGFCSLLIDW